MGEVRLGTPKPNIDDGESHHHQTLYSPKRPSALSLGDEPNVDELTGLIRGMPNWKVACPDSLSAELLNLDHPEFARCFRNILVNVWKTGDTPQH